MSDTQFVALQPGDSTLITIKAVTAAVADAILDAYERPEEVAKYGSHYLIGYIEARIEGQFGLADRSLHNSNGRYPQSF